ncbi:B12-binding domain-containing radical SAM protein [Aquimarina sp. 2201CG14-23]|uniref:B12-binding domain-containing radical SAM protein n=1 Tax=Aquimarina mycalae TaxID=3040073 RepID=UPI002477F143|nr:radical SAM protein [Aquimarina sp. 2201CG14-23]MDH7448058.1 radical SAM protein [Aquimarina sp. 2201CG14-23]
MSIVLTHAYYLSTDPKEQRIMKPYPPLGQLYIAGYLQERIVENYVFDTTFSSKKEQLSFIASKKPDVVAIYANLMTKVEVIKLIKILITEASYGFPKIVLGGPDVTYNTENYLRSGAQYIVIGEGEETLYELYQAIINKTDIHDVPGIAYLDQNKVVKTTARIKMKDLSLLPLPNRKAIDMQKYLDTWKNNHGQSSMTVSTQRGCPYTCKWCSTAVYGQSYRRRPASLVAKELVMLKKEYNPDTVWFVDDVFTVSHKWLAEFHKEVIQQDAIIPFECITRAERLNDEVLQQLKEAGCYRIWIGAESGSQKIVDAMDRRVKVETVRDAIQKTNELGMETGTFIMVGYPGEDEQDIQQTITYLKAANPTHFTITVAYPIKGTSLYNEIENDITIQPDWNTSTDRDIDFKRTYHRKYYDFAVRRIVNEVNYFKKKTSANAYSISTLKLKLKSILAFFAMKYYKLQ